jgi:hypothetical protein
MPIDDHDSRVERLINAIEAQTNMIGRLVRLLEPKAKAEPKPGRVASRRVPLDRPIAVSPIVQAAAKRALAKLNR